MANKPYLLVNEVQDVYIRQNFDELRKFFQSENQLVGFKFFELTFDRAVIDHKVQHNMNYVPMDIIITGTYGSEGSINVGLFDASTMSITVKGPCRLRFFAGKYWNSKGSTIQKTDIIPFNGSGTVSIDSNSSEVPNMAGLIIPTASKRNYKYALPCNGTAYSAAEYPDLALALWDDETGTYLYGGTGRFPNGTFKTPDTRGVFIRALDDGKNIDSEPSRKAGSFQDDAIRNIYGTTQIIPEGGSFNSTGAFANQAGSGSRTAGTASGTNTIINFNASRVVPTAAENRVKNMAFKYMILTK